MNARPSARRWFRETMLEQALAGYAGVLIVIGVLFAVQSSAGAGNDVGGIAALLVGLVALAYGGFRGFYFHPLNNVDYGRWLGDSPWRPGDRLPLGPVGLRWQDAVFIGLLAATSPWASVSIVKVAFPLVCFTVGYCFGIWRAATVQREYLFAFAAPMLAAPALPLWWLASPEVFCWWLVGLAGAVLVLSQVSLARAIREWPMLVWALVPRPLGKELNTRGRPDGGAIGAPAAELLGDLPELRWPPRLAITTGVLTAWCLFCFGYWLYGLVDLELLDDTEQWNVYGTLASFAAAPALAIAVLRIPKIVAVHRPPISLWARLRLRRLILPRYDAILLPPLVGVLAALVLPRGLLLLGVPLPLALALGGGVGVAACLGLPPSLDDWRHTGGYSLHLKNHVSELKT